MESFFFCPESQEWHRNGYAFGHKSKYEVQTQNVCYNLYLNLAKCMVSCIKTLQLFENIKKKKKSGASTHDITD